jgi:hypothetical protein
MCIPIIEYDKRVSAILTSTPFIDFDKLLPVFNSHSSLTFILKPSAFASASGTDRDLAATQFPRNCVAHNIIEIEIILSDLNSTI